MKTQHPFVQFFKKKIWEKNPDDLPLAQSILIRLARTLVLAASGFAKHRGTLRASALTLYTLLSIVPVAAMAFGIAKGFGFEKRLQQELMEKFAGQEEVMVLVINFAESLLENTKGGIIAGVGIAVLFWAVIKVLGNIEAAFNNIWGVKNRTFLRKFSDYLAIMLIGPVLMIMSGSVTVFITTQVTAMSQKLGLSEVIGPALYLSLKLLPYGLIWLLMTLVFLIMPNTKVPFPSALIAGIVAGTSYQLVQAAYISFQVLVARYNAIYGSFAALPLFLIWLQVSWLIVLTGAEIAHAHQGSNYYRPDINGQHTSFTLIKMISLQLCHYVITRFKNGEPPHTADQISKALKLPGAMVESLLTTLVNAGICTKTATPIGDAPSFVPARDINGITINAVISAIEDEGETRSYDLQSESFATISKTLDTLRMETNGSRSNLLIKDM